MSDDVALRLVDHLLKRVGHKAVGDGECFALVDKALKDTAVGGKSAEHFGTVTEDAGYVWGNEVALSDVKAGDVLQFRNHVVTVRTDSETKTKTSWKERTYSRGHHTSVVVAVNADGSVAVVEQKVEPNPKRVTRNTIVRLAAGKETRMPDASTTITITVEGTVKAYRPVPKQKGAFIFRLDDDLSGIRRRMLGSFVPSEGGPRRPAGPVGMG